MNPEGIAVSAFSAKAGRKRIEAGFGWMKMVGAFRKTRFKGSGRTQLSARLVGAACNLMRMAKLGWSPPMVSAPG